MPEVLDDRESHLLLLKDDGSIELVPKSDRNRLLWEYDLFPVLRDREESLGISGDDDFVEIAPAPPDDSAAFYVTSSKHEYAVPENKLDILVQMLVEAYEETPGDGPQPEPIIRQLRSLLDTAVDPDVVDSVADLPTFAGRVDVTETGWVIHDHLLLTYDNEFFNLYTASKERSGSDAVPAGSKQEAYTIRTPRPRRFDGVLEGKAAPEDAEFLIRALWAIDHTTP